MPIDFDTVKPESNQLQRKPRSKGHIVVVRITAENLELEALTENTFTTGWLDTLITNELTAERPDAALGVVCGAVTASLPARPISVSFAAWVHSTSHSPPLALSVTAL
jgi:hypothetical protein